MLKLIGSKDNLSDIFFDQTVMLEHFCSFDTQSKKHQNINDLQIVILNMLSQLGFSCELVKNSSEKSGNLLIARKSGKTEKCITFIGHIDTVCSKNKINFHVDKKKNRVFGVGAADAKGGIVIALFALANFLKKYPDHLYSINIIISPNEELGSLGFHQFFHNIGQSSDFIFGLEPADDKGNIIKSRSGNRWYDVEVIGKSAHSGRFGASHINAGHELSRIISHLYQYNCENKKIRFNVGSISTDTNSYNTICGKANAKFDFRFPDFLSIKNLHENFLKIISNHQLYCPYTVKTAQTKFQIVDDCPPMEKTERNTKLIDMFRESIKFFENREVNSFHSGGAADVNYFVHSKNLAIDGLGPIGGGFHTHKEYIEFDSLYTRSKSLFRSLVIMETYYGNKSFI